jgi:hypothetical protein
VQATMRLVTVEFTQPELLTVLALVRARAAEFDKMIQNLEEGEGMDAGRHGMLRTMRPQAEALSDLVLKLEGAAKELERR